MADYVPLMVVLFALVAGGRSALIDFKEKRRFWMAFDVLGLALSAVALAALGGIYALS